MAVVVVAVSAVVVRSLNRRVVRGGGSGSGSVSGSGTEWLVGMRSSRREL